MWICWMTHSVTHTHSLAGRTLSLAHARRRTLSGTRRHVCEGEEGRGGEGARAGCAEEERGSSSKAHQGRSFSTGGRVVQEHRDAQ